MSITGWLIMINIWFFVEVVLLGPFLRISILDFGIQPRTFLNGERWWALITHMFMHGNLWHLLTNMIVLFNFGIPFELILGK